MQYTVARPPAEDAWRVSEASPGIAHFFGWANDRDDQSMCWADVPVAGTRRAAGEDQICPDCDGWYWQHVSVSWLADRTA